MGMIDSMNDFFRFVDDKFIQWFIIGLILFLFLIWKFGRG
jgi:hypothetical protein